MYLTHKTYLQSILVETPFNPRPKALKMTKNGGEMGCFSRMKYKHSAQNFFGITVHPVLLFTRVTLHGILFTDTVMGLFMDIVTGYCSRHYSRILLRGTIHGYCSWALCITTVHSAVKNAAALFFSCLNRYVNLPKYTRSPRDLN